MEKAELNPARTVAVRSAVESFSRRGVHGRGVPARGVPTRGVPGRGVTIRGVPTRGVPGLRTRLNNIE